MKFKFTEEVYYTCIGRASHHADHLWTCEYDEFTSKELHWPIDILQKREDLKIKHIMLGVLAKSYFNVEKTLNCLIDSTPPALSWGLPEHIGCMLGWDIWSDYKLPSSEQFMQDGDILLVAENKEEEIRDAILIRLHRPARGMRPLTL